MKVIEQRHIDEAERMRNAGKAWEDIGKALGFNRERIRKAVDPQFAARVRERLRIKAQRGRDEAREIRMMRREAGIELCGMEDRIDPALVERRRAWTLLPDTRSLTGRLLGDPIYERSALYQKRIREGQEWKNATGSSSRQSRSSSESPTLH